MIHPSAVIGKNAEIHETTHIGPFCIIGDGVKIGENNNIYPFVSIGNDPQDLKFYIYLQQ